MVQGQANSNLQFQYDMSQMFSQRSYNNQSPSKNKLMHLLKRIAQLQLRQARQIEKIKYLQASNLRLINQKQEQLQLMNCYPTSQIQNLIVSLQSQIKRLATISSQNIDKQRQVWLKKYQQMSNSNTRLVESQRQKRLQLQYEIKLLRQNKIHNNAKFDFNNTINVSTNYEIENQKLKRQINLLQLRNQQLQSQYVNLQTSIEGKFQILDQQISFYQKQRQQSLNKINRLEQQLRLRDNCDGFSFSNNKQHATPSTGTKSQNYQQQEQKHQKQQSIEQYKQQIMDLSCYRSSIESLLQQNTRLKKSIIQLQQLLKEHNHQIPKEIQIQLSLLKRVGI